MKSVILVLGVEIGMVLAFIVGGCVGVGLAEDHARRMQEEEK